MPIFDQGYQHWKGPLSSHAWRWWAVTRHGLRVQLRGWIVRILLGCSWLPALGLVVFLALWGLMEQGTASVLRVLQPILPPEIVNEPQAFRTAIWTAAYAFFFQCQIFFLMLLVVVTGPNLISRDLRFNALPLYLARPVRRIDYFAGKLGVIGFLVAAVAVGPALVAYVLGVAFSLDISVIRDTWRVLLGSLGYGFLMVISVGTLILALSSLSRRSLYVGITWVGLWVLGGGVSGALSGIHQGSIRREIADAELAKMGLAWPAPPRGRPDQDEWKKWGEEMRNIRGRLQPRVDRAWGEAAASDWRPLFSYTNSLSRLGDEMLGTDAAWERLGAAIEAPRAALGPFMKPMRRGGLPFGGPAPEPPYNRRFANQMVFQFPWIWSAGLLATLLGLSLWILSRRVKSLDRLS